MKTLKTFTCLILVFALVFAFAACGGKENGSGNTDKAAEDVNPEQGVIDIEHYDYKSESLGVGVKLNDSWNLRTSEELMALMGATKFGDAIKNAPLVYDFYATKGLNTGSFVVIFENMVKSYGRAYDTDEYIGVLRSSMRSMLQSQGLDVTVLEEITRTVGGKEMKGFYIEAVAYGVTTYEYVLLKRCGDFMADITIGDADKAELDKTLAMFYGLN